MARSTMTLATATTIAAGTPIHHDQPASLLTHNIVRAANHPASDTNNVHPGRTPLSLFWLMFLQFVTREPHQRAVPLAARDSRPRVTLLIDRNASRLPVV